MTGLVEFEIITSSREDFFSLKEKIVEFSGVFVLLAMKV